MLHRTAEYFLTMTSNSVIAGASDLVEGSEVISLDDAVFQNNIIHPILRLGASQATETLKSVPLHASIPKT
jgi:hypothetical protein